MGNISAKVLELADRQWGRISAAQFGALGVDRHTVSRWTDSGYLHVVHPRVYAVGHRAPTVEADLWAAVLYAGFWLLRLIYPPGMGGGDVKLAFLLGLYLGWLGWGAVVVGAVAGFAIQAVLAVGLLAVRRVGLRTELPFGPAMLLGAAVAIGWADAIAHAYLGVGGAA